MCVCDIINLNIIILYVQVIKKKEKRRKEKWARARGVRYV